MANFLGWDVWLFFFGLFSSRLGVLRCGICKGVIYSSQCSMRCTMGAWVGIYLDKFLQYSTFDTFEAQGVQVSPSTHTHHSSITTICLITKHHDISAIASLPGLLLFLSLFPYTPHPTKYTLIPSPLNPTPIIPSIYSCPLKSTFIRKPRITKKFDRGVSSMFRPVVKKQVRKKTSRRKTWS
jgi:hypothetical protein